MFVICVCFLCDLFIGYEVSINKFYNFKKKNENCTAIGRLQLKVGPQKWVVLGPIGLFQNDLRMFIFC